jgi:glyoxylase-like metal-dependent hydrolase (beta-lactamase superfamily II)
MIFERLVVGPLQCNCLILGCEKSREAIVVDAGDEAERILQVLNRHRLTLKTILQTHAHLDHVGASHRLQGVTSATVALHRGDLFLLENLSMQAAFLGLEAPSPARIDHYLMDEEEMKVGSLRTDVIHTPGHTPGSLCFHLPG